MWFLYFVKVYRLLKEGILEINLIFVVFFFLIRMRGLYYWRYGLERLEVFEEFYYLFVFILIFRI